MSEYTAYESSPTETALSDAAWHLFLLREGDATVTLMPRGIGFGQIGVLRFGG